MSMPAFNAATHISIAWAVTLAVLTILEWRSLDRDPIGQQILTPFIQREITIIPVSSAVYDQADITAQADTASKAEPRYEVELTFNGPLFLAYFFGPVALFHGLGLVLAKIKRK